MAACCADDGQTWKALSTLEWKQKQKRPAAATPKGVGAILGEAADVVAGKWANGGAAGSLGPTGSAYLSRLSEIQIQDEAYIHQQLVKPPEEGLKLRRRQAHSRLLLPLKGSRSGKGLKLSTSRKVRFNEADSSSAQRLPTAAPPAGTTATCAKSTTLAPCSAGSGTGSTSSSAHEATSSKAMKHAAVGFASAPDDSTNCIRISNEPVRTTASQFDAAAPAPAFCTSVDNIAMSRFLQPQQPQQPHQPQQPMSVAADAPLGLRTISGTATVAGGRGAHQQPYHHPQGSQLRRRESTDLVDKQLQWLRDSTSTSSSSDNGSGSAEASSSNTAASLQHTDFTLSLGYRPFAIPQELFDRWSNMGAAKPVQPAQTQPPCATPTQPPQAKEPAAASTAIRPAADQLAHASSRTTSAGPHSRSASPAAGSAMPVAAAYHPARRLSASNVMEEGRNEVAVRQSRRPPPVGNRQRLQDSATLLTVDAAASKAPQAVATGIQPPKSSAGITAARLPHCGADHHLACLSPPASSGRSSPSASRPGSRLTGSLSNSSGLTPTKPAASSAAGATRMNGSAALFAAVHDVATSSGSTGARAPCESDAGNNSRHNSSTPSSRRSSQTGQQVSSSRDMQARVLSPSTGVGAATEDCRAEQITAAAATGISTWGNSSAVQGQHASAGVHSIHVGQSGRGALGVGQHRSRSSLQQ